MKKFNKILTVLVAFAMIVSSLTMLAIHDEHVHVHAAETAKQNVWRLKADLSSTTQGQFSFVFATDRPQTFSAPETPTAADGVLKNTEGKTMFYVKDGFIFANSYHSSIGDTWGIVFTAPEDGIYYYDITWNLSPTNNAWNNKWIYNPTEGWKWPTGTAINGNATTDYAAVSLKAGEKIVFSVSSGNNTDHDGYGTTVISDLSVRTVERLDATNFTSTTDNFTFLTTGNTHSSIWNSTSSYVFNYEDSNEAPTVAAEGTSLVSKVEGAAGLGDNATTPRIFPVNGKLRIEDKYRNNIVRYTAPATGTYKMILNFNLVDLDPNKDESTNFNAYFFAGKSGSYDVVRDSTGRPLQFAAASNNAATTLAATAFLIRAKAFPL